MVCHCINTWDMQIDMATWQHGNIICNVTALVVFLSSNKQLLFKQCFDYSLNWLVMLICVLWLSDEGGWANTWCTLYLGYWIKVGLGKRLSYMLAT